MSADMELVRNRINEKKEDYSRYKFSETESNALKTFFDLAQEYDTLHNLYRVCVAVPKEYFGLESRLYLVDDKNDLGLVCTSISDLDFNPSEVNKDVHIEDQPYTVHGSYVIPIKGNRFLVEKLPFYAKGQLLGMLEVFPCAELNESGKFFFQKYANRIGYNLNQKIIWQQNIDHIKFINNLVADIEHNVITPNIFYKLFFKNLHLKLSQCLALEKELSETLVSFSGENRIHVNNITQSLYDLLASIKQEYEQIYKHYENTSLFLETLFRRGHFERGHWVLRKKCINVTRDIIVPQLDRHKKRLHDKGISIVNEGASFAEEEEVLLNVDVGLIAQVYSNLFSNAEKYAQEVVDTDGRRLKFLAFSHEKVSNYSGKGKNWIKFNVFTTGPHLSPQDAARIYDEGYRGSNAATRPGTGHGLHFVKNVIEVHGGYVGHEPVAHGNNFYFVLPC